MMAIGASFMQQSSPVPNHKRSLRAFSLGYRVALFATAVICVAALLIEYKYAASQRQNLPAIDLVGRERMLAERLVATTITVANPHEKAATRANAKVALSRTLSDWKAAHEELLNFVAREGADDLKATIDATTGPRQTLETSARKVMVSDSLTDLQISTLSQASAKFQYSQQRVLGGLLAFTDAKVRRLSAVLGTSTLVILGALLLQGLLLFRPLINRTTRSFNLMEKNQEELEFLRGELETQNVSLQSNQIALIQAGTRSEDLARLSRFAAARFEELFAGLPIAAFTFDVTGVAFEWNREAEAVFGIPASKAIGVPFVDLIGLPESRSEISDIVQGVFKGDHFYNIERNVRRASGDIRLAILNIFPLRDPDGSINGGVCSLVDITEQRGAEERLRASERRFRQMAEDLPTGAILIEDNKMFVNRYVEEMTGYQRQELPDLDTWFETIYPDHAEAVTAIYQQHKDLGFKSSPIVPITRKDGEVRHVEFSAYAADDNEIWLLHDVTEKLASQERFRVLFEHSSDAHLLFDDSGIVDCNEAAVRMLGGNDKAHILSLHPAVFSPEHQPDGRRSDEKCIEMDARAQTEGYHRFEWTHRKMDGTDFPVEVTLTHVNLGGKDTLLTVWHDLTDQKRHEQQIREANEALNQAQSIARIGSWQCDRDFANSTWSPEMYRLFGFDQGDLLPSIFELFAMIHPEDVHEFKKVVLRTKRHGQPWTCEYRFNRRDGEERIVVSTGQPVDEGKRFAGTFQDVTEARLEARLIQESETLFRTTMDAVHAGMAYMDRSGKVTMVNPKGAEILGLRPEQLGDPNQIEAGWLLINEDGTTVEPEDFPLTKAFISNVPFESDVRGVRRPNGEVVWISINAAPVILSGQTTPIGAVASFTDITEMRAQHDLLMSEMVKTNELAIAQELQQHELEAANQMLAELATTDGLTSLKNHRSFQEFLEQQFAMARRSKLPLSLLLLDVDKFKTFNDEFGHQAGDEVLRGVAQTLAEEARKSDFVARYGGEEFVVVLPDTNEEGAILVAEKLRKAIEERGWSYRSVTASFGAATLESDMKGREELIARADSALYESKRAGRNRVTHAHDVPKVA
jgi:diguanylate cyclase (GGDEF)-like protein/PAS domain S-box-containing protein